jgi:hypothetical protein
MSEYKTHRLTTEEAGEGSLPFFNKYNMLTIADKRMIVTADPETPLRSACGRVAAMWYDSEGVLIQVKPMEKTVMGTIMTDYTEESVNECFLFTPHYDSTIESLDCIMSHVIMKPAEGRPVSKLVPNG